MDQLFKFTTVHRNSQQFQSSVSEVIILSWSASALWLTHLGVPVLIQVINTGDAAPVTIWVVHVTNVPGSISRITSDHGLKDKGCKKYIFRDFFFFFFSDHPTTNLAQHFSDGQSKSCNRPHQKRFSHKFLLLGGSASMKLQAGNKYPSYFTV